MQKYTSLTLDLIEEGRMKVALQEELDLIQRALVLYRKRYGPDSKGAKAELNLKLTLKIEDPDDEFYSITSAISSKRPGRPQRATLAIEGEDEKGRPILFTRKSGTTQEHPGQTLLFTDDGRPIDLETGEILEEAPEQPQS